MDLHQKDRLIILLSLLGMGVLAGLFGLSQVHSKIYFPIDQETLVITEAIDLDHSIA